MARVHPTLLDMFTGTLALLTAIDLFLVVTGGGNPEATWMSELELLEEAVARAPQSEYVGIDLRLEPSAATIARFLDKHREFELVSTSANRLFLKRKFCDE
ncbi:MAG TPA: hypothetical protein VJJ02_04565 [Candidatus Paceibacterota bacterium]